MTRDSLRRALRTFLITTLALFIPGLLGWLNDVTAWASGNGEHPFPDGHGLLFLAVSACVAGVVAVVNLIWNVVEDATGRGVLRNVPARPARGDGGYLRLWGSTPTNPHLPARGPSRDRSIPGKARIRARRADR